MKKRKILAVVAIELLVAVVITYLMGHESPLWELTQIAYNTDDTVLNVFRFMGIHGIILVLAQTVLFIIMTVVIGELIHETSKSYQ